MSCSLNACAPVEVFSVTVPKSSEVGFSVKPSGIAPVPLTSNSSSSTLPGSPTGDVRIETLQLCIPGACGANVIVNGTTSQVVGSVALGPQISWPMIGGELSAKSGQAF